MPLLNVYTIQQAISCDTRGAALCSAMITLWISKNRGFCKCENPGVYLIFTVYELSPSELWYFMYKMTKSDYEVTNKLIFY